MPGAAPPHSSTVSPPSPYQPATILAGVKVVPPSGAPP
jgi:hypothetical protein